MINFLLLIIVCVEGDLRLSDGSSSEGLVELCRGGQWGTVCQNFWDSKEARVVCIQLGYESQSAVGFLSDGRERSITNPTNFNCSGNERNLSLCQACTSCVVDTQTCQHSNVGVSCFSNGDQSHYPYYRFLLNVILSWMFQGRNVMMETFVLLEELIQEKGDWKCVCMDCGDLSVAIMFSLQLTA